MCALATLVGCFEPRVEKPADGAPPADAATAPLDAAPPPEPIDCDGLARQVNERPDELPAGVCRPGAAPCEWRNVCVGGVEATLRCACGADDGGARWRCEASGDAPCRSWADASFEAPPRPPPDAPPPDFPDVAPAVDYAACDEILRMLATMPGERPGGACGSLGQSCEWPHYCLRGHIIHITCRCRAMPPSEGLWWGCDGFSFGETCGGGPDAGAD